VSSTDILYKCSRCVPTAKVILGMCCPSANIQEVSSADQLVDQLLNRAVPREASEIMKSSYGMVEFAVEREGCK